MNIKNLTLEVKEFRRRSFTIGIFLFFINFALYWLSFIGIIYTSIWWLKYGFSILNGMFISTLFIVGHDAGHGSLLYFPLTFSLSNILIFALL